MLNEQRQVQRKILKVKVQVAPDNADHLAGRTMDISASGLCASLGAPLKIGVNAQLRFELLLEGKPSPIQARCKVSYCILSGSEFKVGFQFLNLDLAAMTAVARFMR